MTETPRNGAGPAPEAPDEDFTSDEAVETAALAGAAAVQRLVAERNNLRNRLAAQQRELAAMRGINEDLRRRLFAIHQRYVDVAKRVVGQLEQFDGTIREVLQPGAQGANGAAAPREEQAAPPASLPAGLVERLAEAAPPAAPTDQPATPQTKT